MRFADIAIHFVGNLKAWSCMRSDLVQFLSRQVFRKFDSGQRKKHIEKKKT